MDRRISASTVNCSARKFNRTRPLVSQGSPTRVMNEGLCRIGTNGKTIRKYHSEYWRASVFGGNSISMGGFLFVVDRRKARSDLLYNTPLLSLPGGLLSMSGTSKCVMSIVVPSTDSWVPFMELNGALSEKTPRWPSTGCDSRAAERE